MKIWGPLLVKTDNIVGLYGLKRKIDQVMALLQEHETWAKAAMPFALGKQFWALCVMVMMTVAALIALLFFSSSSEGRF